MNENEYAIVIHGGAGTILKKNMSDELEVLYRDKMKEALEAGHYILKKMEQVLMQLKLLLKSLRTLNFLMQEKVRFYPTMKRLKWMPP